MNALIGKTTHATYAAQRLRGFSLIEMMIAMVLSLVLLGGALSVFSGTRATYENIDQLTRIQENGRFALDQIVRDIRSAGFVGCAKAVPYINNTLRNPTTLLWNFANPIQGFEGTSTSAWSPTLDTNVPSAAISGTTNTLNDVLVLRVPRRGAIPSRLTVGMGSGASNLTIADATPAPVAQKDVVMVSNCQGQAFFEVTNYTVAAGVGTIEHTTSLATAVSPGNLSATVVYPFTIDSEVVPVVTNIYYLATSTEGTSTALWRKSGKAPAEELIEGVDGMSLFFGIDTTGDQQADSYVKAGSVTNWAQVVSVRVALLIRSIEEYGNTTLNTRTYSLLGTTSTTTSSFADRRQRQVFTSTVTLRNKAL